MDQILLSQVPEVIRGIQSGKIDLLDFGIDNKKGVEQLSNQIMSTISNSDLGKIGERINQVVSLCRNTKNVITESGQKSIWAKIPIISMFVNKYNLTINQIKDRFAASEKQIDEISRDLTLRINNSKNSIKLLQDLSKQIDFYYDINRVNIEAGKTYVKYIEGEIKNYKSSSSYDVNNQNHRKELERLELLKTMASSSINDFIQFEGLIAFINEIVSNNIKNAILAIQSMQNHIVNSIPAWKILCQNYIINLQTNANIDIIRNIRLATEDMIEESVKSSTENALNISKELATGFIDINVLLKATDNLINSLEEPNRIMASINSSTITLEESVSTIRNNLSKGATNGN